jgi:hypothetical protein
MPVTVVMLVTVVPEVVETAVTRNNGGQTYIIGNFTIVFPLRKTLAKGWGRYRSHHKPIVVLGKCRTPPPGLLQRVLIDRSTEKYPWQGPRKIVSKS